MTFNVNTCKHMHLGNRMKTPNKYNMKDANNKLTQINQVDKEKDLGVTFQNNLKFNQHISEKISKANRNLGLIFKTFTYMDKEMFLTLYKALVRPHIEYATVIWSPHYKKNKLLLKTCKDVQQEWYLT